MNGTDGGKLDHFPIVPGSFRARREEDNWKKEDVDLLDPIDPEDWKLLTFRPNGQPIPLKPPGTREHDRAKISIQVYHLITMNSLKGEKSKRQPFDCLSKRWMRSIRKLMIWR
jgi:hypothetical protein